MRKNIVAGNWKMNTTLAEGVGLAKDVNEALKGFTPKCDVIICTPSPIWHLLPPLSIRASSASAPKTALTTPKALIPAKFPHPW